MGSVFSDLAPEWSFSHNGEHEVVSPKLTYFTFSTRKEACLFSWFENLKQKLQNSETENAELKKQLSKLENFTTLLCGDVFDMMCEMDLIELSNYKGLLDVVERGRDGDFDG